MMRKLFTSAAILLGLVGGAAAADLPSRMAPPVFVPPVIPPYTWTGVYVGGRIGYSWDGTEIFTNTWSHGVTRHGVAGGLFSGYNYQISNLVLGIQGEYNLSGISGGVTPLPTYTLSTRVGSFGSVDGRLGWAFDRFLAYAIGGVAFGDFHHTIVLTNVPETDSFRAFQVGYDIGGGLEYAFTNNWSVRAEYRSYNFGTKSFSPVGLLGPNHTKETLSSVVLGISYKFGGYDVPMPVVAKY